MRTEHNKGVVNQTLTLKKALAFVLIPTLILSIIILKFQTNSHSYLKKEYDKIHNSSYSGRITNMLPNEGDERIRLILINNNQKREVPFYIYNKLNVGDSLYKKRESDYEYYIKKTTSDTIKRDVNTFYRLKYFKKLNQR